MSEVSDISEEGNKKSAKEGKDALPPIIKKVKKHGHGHHGGAWKIAFADFVTAMMAFFLLMWLLASLNKSQKEAIADYFKQPIKAALFGGENYGNQKVNVQSGGPKPDEKPGQIQATNKPVAEKKDGKEAEDQEAKKAESKSLEELKSEINVSIDKDPSLAGLKDQLRMDNVTNGLRIQLIDNKKTPMFDVGSEKLSPSMVPILNKIAKLLNTVPNKVTIQGYTDAHPYHDPQELDYTNWELSSQRANAARRALIQAGMNEDKVMSVSGFGATQLFNPTDPYSPENRRISIIVMNKKAEENDKQAGQPLEQPTGKEGAAPTAPATGAPITPPTNPTPAAPAPAAPKEASPPAAAPATPAPTAPH